MVKEYTHKTSKSSKILQKDFLSVIKSLTPLDRRVLNYLIFIYTHHDDIYPSQSRIASRVSATRESVNRSLQKMKRLNLLTIQFKSGSFDFDSRVYILSENIFLNAQSLKRSLSSLNRYIKESCLTDDITSYKVLSKIKSSFVSQSTIVREDRVHSQKLRGYRLKSKREVIDMVTNKPIISTTLREITETLQLTKHGQCKLLAFDDIVLEKVWNQSKKLLHTIKDPMGYMIKSCSTQSTLDSIAVNWEVYYLLLKTQKVSSTQPLVRKQEPTNRSVVVRSSIEHRIPEWQLKYENKEIHNSFKNFIPEWVTLEQHVN